MKLRTITLDTLRNECATILREVEAGRSLLISRNGAPVAELRPVKQRRFVQRSTLADAQFGAAPIDAVRFRADLKKLVR
jgi:prevent-host-death family protein